MYVYLFTLIKIHMVVYPKTKQTNKNKKQKTLS